MVLIGVVSDSHDNVWAVERAARLLRDRGASLVVHLGDIVAPFTLRRFREAGVEKLVAVFGNNCGERPGLMRVAAEAGFEIGDWPRLLEVGGRRLLLLHGSGPPEATRMLVDSLAASGRYDAILYGHTHAVDVRNVDGTLVLNPGELCGCLTGRRSAALLDTSDMRVEIVEV